MINKEKMVFELYKDKPVASKTFRPLVKRKFKLNDKQITNLYARINNYQLKKYGRRIDKGEYIEYYTPEEYERIKVNRRNLKNQRLYDTSYINRKQRNKEMM